MIGSTGCRGLTGQWTISGSEVVMTELGASGDCSSELAAQDSHVISSLEGGFRVEIDGERLTTWSRGDEGLTYKADG